MKRPEQISFVQTAQSSQYLANNNDTKIEYNKFPEGEKEFEVVFTSEHVLMSAIVHLQLDFLINILENSLPSYQFPEIEEYRKYDVEFYSDYEDTLNFIGTSPK